jgi:Ca-activated chloride channel family protein
MKITTILFIMMSYGVHAKPDTMIVLDASGSMWGQIDGTSKIEIARGALKQVSTNFSADQKVGLMAYGHRRKGDCGDIEVLLSPATNQADKIITTVNGLMPKGKTPLSAAVKQAADILKITENAAEIILITDGLETCDLDPCKTGEELAALGIDFKAHVIGFGLNADEGKQVACLAESTGGLYVPAQNAGELDKALQQLMIEEVVAEPEVELPTATIQAPQQPPVIGAQFQVNWQGPNNERDYIDIVEQDAIRTYGELAYVWANKQSPAMINAPSKPGIYQLRYIWQGPLKRHVVTQVEFEVVDTDVSLSAPEMVHVGASFEVSWQGPGGERDYVDLVPADYVMTAGELSYFYADKTKESENTGTLTAPADAGDYKIRYVLQGTKDRQVLHSIPIQVKPVETQLSHDPQAGIGQQLKVQWTGPDSQGDYIDVVPENHDMTAGEISYFYTENNAPEADLTMPIEPGQYKIRYVMSAPKGRKVIVSSPITVVDVPTSIHLDKNTAASGSELIVHWQGPGKKGDYIDLVPADYTATYGELSYFYTQSNPEQGVLRMPDQAGEYQVRYILQGNQKRVIKASVPLMVE